MEPLVSIIIPVYNEEKYISCCVDRFLKQTYHNIEIILVDDGSTNTAGTICDSFAEKDDRVKVIHKKNEGLSAARITGLKAAAGDWVMFSDHDDLVSLEIVKRLLQERKPDIDIVTGGRMDFDTDQVVDFSETIGDDSVVVLSGREVCEKIPEDYQQSIITPLWGKIYRADFLYKLELEKYKRICPVVFFEDVLVTPMLYSKARKVAIVKQTLYAHREVKTSVSRSGKLSRFYYDQIESGNILLQYAYGQQLKEYYKYQLKIYMNSIMRIYMLTDHDECVKSVDKKQVKKKIILYFQKYKDVTLKRAELSKTTKFSMALFDVSPELWRRIAYWMYKKGRVSRASLGR